MVDYFSKRRMGSLAVGIIKGIAQFYNESDTIDERPLINAGEEGV